MRIFPFYGLQAGFLYMLTLAAAHLPRSVNAGAGAFIGFLMSAVLFKRRAIAIENIKNSIPYMLTHPLWNHRTSDPATIAGETFRNLGHSFLEICRLYHGRGEHLLESVEIRGLENYNSAREHGKGVIFFTGHCGNWELLALAFSRITGEKLSVVARKQKNPYINRIAESLRNRYNNKVIYKDGALKHICAELKKNGNVGLLADQSVSRGEGFLLNFLGREAWTSKIPALIARKTGATLLPVFIFREEGKNIITIFPPHNFCDCSSKKSLKLDTADLSRYVEIFAIKSPDQWYWVHRRWKHTGEQTS